MSEQIPHHYTSNEEPLSTWLNNSSENHQTNEQFNVSNERIAQHTFKRQNDQSTTFVYGHSSKKQKLGNIPSAYRSPFVLTSLKDEKASARNNSTIVQSSLAVPCRTSISTIRRTSTSTLPFPGRTSTSTIQFPGRTSTSTIPFAGRTSTSTIRFPANVISNVSNTNSVSVPGVRHNNSFYPSNQNINIVRLPGDPNGNVANAKVVQLSAVPPNNASILNVANPMYYNPNLIRIPTCSSHPSNASTVHISTATSFLNPKVVNLSAVSPNIQVKGNTSSHSISNSNTNIVRLPGNFPSSNDNRPNVVNLTSIPANNLQRTNLMSNSNTNIVRLPGNFPSSNDNRPNVVNLTSIPANNLQRTNLMRVSTPSIQMSTGSTLRMPTHIITDQNPKVVRLSAPVDPSTNVKVVRLPTNLGSSPLSPIAKIVRQPSNIVFNRPNANVIQLPGNGVSNATNIVRLPGNMAATPPGSPRVVHLHSNIVRQPNIVHLSSNVSPNLTNPNIVRLPPSLIHNPSYHTLFRLPTNVIQGTPPPPLPIAPRVVRLQYLPAGVIPVSRPPIIRYSSLPTVARLPLQNNLHSTAPGQFKLSPPGYLLPSPTEAQQPPPSFTDVSSVVVETESPNNQHTLMKSTSSKEEMTDKTPVVNDGVVQCSVSNENLQTDLIKTEPEVCVISHVEGKKVNECFQLVEKCEQQLLELREAKKQNDAEDILFSGNCIKVEDLEAIPLNEDRRESGCIEQQQGENDVEAICRILLFTLVNDIVEEENSKHIRECEAKREIESTCEIDQAVQNEREKITQDASCGNSQSDTSTCSVKLVNITDKDFKEKNEDPSDEEISEQDETNDGVKDDKTSTGERGVRRSKRRKHKCSKKRSKRRTRKRKGSESDGDNGDVNERGRGCKRR